MAIIIILIAISLTIAVFFLIVFYWNMRSGQYDDTYTPSVRMLFEDKRPGNHTTVKGDPAVKGSSTTAKRTWDAPLKK